MGKMSDALERYRSEKAIKTNMLPFRTPEKSVKKKPESPFFREMAIQKGLDPKLIVLSAPGSFEAEKFKILKVQVLFPKGGKRPRTIMVTSAFPGEGKTFVSANLAVSLSQGIGEYTLLIDCDLRRPKLHNMLGYSNSKGLHEYLMGKAKLDDLVIPTQIEKLSLLTAGKPSDHPSEMMSSVKMKELFEKARERHKDRFVIIDAPPSQFLAEAGVLANHVDGIIFVIMAGQSPREDIQKSITDLGKDKILGVVFNGYSRSYRHFQKYYEGYYK